MPQRFSREHRPATGRIAEPLAALDHDNLLFAVSKQRRRRVSAAG
jgi:hypothetical protein